MNFQKLIFALLFSSAILVGCDEPPEKTNERIDKGVEGAKELLDLLGEKGKEVVGDEELQAKLKDILKDVEVEAKDLGKLLETKGDKLQEEIEKLKNDPKYKEKFKNLENDGKEILNKLEEIFKDIEKN